MYMTVLKINHETLQKQEYPVDFNNMEFLHRWLTSQFGKGREEEKMLFRLIYTKESVFFYIQSKDPFPEKNVERAGMSVFGSFQVEKPAVGEQISFKLFCSAEKASGDKRYFILDPKEREAWLKRKLSEGLENISVKETNLSSVTIKDGRKIRGVEFSGIAVISDPEVFFAMVESGIGRCKNYGLGLLLFKDAV